LLDYDDKIINNQGMYKSRLLTDRLKKLAGAFPAVVVSGARQVGKSTLIRHVFGRTADIVVFDPVQDIENARQDPELFLSNHKTPLVLDEIQYAPEVISAVKRRIDRDRTPGQYIITGSQQWGVLKSMAESLAGRAMFIDLEGFCLAEIAEQIEADHWLAQWLENPQKFSERQHPRLPLDSSLYELLWRGWLPQACFLETDLIGEFYQAYLRTYIERDVRLLADVADWQLFGRFVQLTAALTAQEINYSQFGRELGITPQTSRRWLAMLRATYQWFEVPAYSGNTVKRISGKPKGYFADTGLACSLQAISSARAIAGHPLLGTLFETAVAGEIRKLSAAMSPKPNMYHWRTQDGAEVDLLLELNGFFFPIEIKVKSQPSKNDTRGISAFRKTYPRLKIAPGLVIAPTDGFRPISEKDYALPWDSR
jgi:hypothetical protein